MVGCRGAWPCAPTSFTPVFDGLGQAWAEFDLTVHKGLEQLTTLCATQILVKGEARCNQRALWVPQVGDVTSYLLPRETHRGEVDFSTYLRAEGKFMDSPGVIL